MATVDVVVFGVLSVVMLFAALKMVNAKELMHAVVWLALVLVGVAGIFLTLSAEFLAAIQILVYVGAVVTLILFTVMVTSPAEPTEGYAEDKTPLKVLGIPAPPGWDIEYMEELPPEDDEGTPGAGLEPATGAVGAEEE